MQQTFFGRAKSIAGAALVGLGIFIFCEHLHRAATQFSHLLGTVPGEALGLLPTAILAASRVLQVHAAGQQQFLQGFLQYMLISSWPLVLVVVGTLLSRDAFTGDVNAPPKKDRELVDLTAGRSTSK